MIPFLLHRPATALLLAANLAVFALGAFPGTGVRAEAWIDEGGLSAQAFWLGEWHRLATNLFLHANLLHLAMNLMILAPLGADLEARAGTFGMLLAYALSGLGGDVASLLFLPANVPTIGASGAVFGVAGAHLALETDRGRTPTSFLQLAWGRSLVFLLVVNFALGAFMPMVNAWAHAGGFVAGFAVARLALIRRARAVPARVWGMRAGLAILALEICHYAWAPVARADYRIVRAWKAAADARLADAESWLSPLLESNPDAPPQASYLLGYVWLSSGRPAEALARLSSDDDPFPLFWRGQALRLLGREGEARDAFTRAGGALQAHADMLGAMAEVARAGGDLDQAVRFGTLRKRVAAQAARAFERAGGVAPAGKESLSAGPSLF